MCVYDKKYRDLVIGVWNSRVVMNPCNPYATPIAQVLIEPHTNRLEHPCN